MFGYAVTMYMVLLTTIGAASSPFSTPSEKVNATPRFLTVVVLIWFSSE